MKKSQTMCLGWNQIGDISEFKNKEELTKALQVANNKDDVTFTNDSLALWQFVHEIEEGDIVYVKQGIKNYRARYR